MNNVLPIIFIKLEEKVLDPINCSKDLKQAIHVDFTIALKHFVVNASKPFGHRLRNTELI